MGRLIDWLTGRPRKERRDDARGQKILDPHCPYCNHLFDPPPESETHCPSCDKPVFLKFVPTKGKYRLARRDQIETEQGRPQTVIQTVDALGEQEVREAERELKRLGGQLRDTDDIYWVVANRKLAEARKDAQWATMKSIYERLARRLHEKGKDHLNVGQLASECQLRGLGPSGATQVAIAIANDTACPQCKREQGRQFSVTEATEKMPLPVEDCSFQARQDGQRGWCRCTYVAVPDV